MSHVDFEKCRVFIKYFPHRHMSNLRKKLCPTSLYFYPVCHMSLSPMLHLDFKEKPMWHVALSILGSKGHGVGLERGHVDM